MDFYQGVVIDYLRADRAMFVNTECCIQINAADNPDGSGPHWYCDAIAVNFRESSIYLCEISYSMTLDKLYNRVKQWNEHWPALCNAVVRDCHLPSTWPVRPWVFIPNERRDLLSKRLQTLTSMGVNVSCMPTPLITSLEDVVPWRYNSWNRSKAGDKSSETCSL